MYADDTTLFCNIDSIPEANRHIVLNSELDNINCWLASNKLSLNVSKTKYMIFHANHKEVVYPDLKINNTIIERVVNFNFLGLLISANAKWACHIDHVSRKVSRAIGIINAMKKTFPISTLVTLYNSLIMPHINYCLLIWGASSNVNKLCLLQKKILRMVTASNYIAHTEPIFKNLNILKIEDLYKLKMLKFHFNLIRGTLPSKFDVFCPKQSLGSSCYKIRNPKYVLPGFKHEFVRKGFHYNLIVIINNTPSFVFDKIYTHSIQGFALYIKQYILNSYSNICLVENCYVCSQR